MKDVAQSGALLLLGVCLFAGALGFLLPLPPARALPGAASTAQPSTAIESASAPGFVHRPVRPSDLPPGADGEGPSYAIFPSQKIAIEFNHEKHVKGLKIGCTSCHELALTSRASADSLLPKPARCDGCHGTDHRDLRRVLQISDNALARCASCHRGYRPEHGNRVERTYLPRPNLRFDHRAHARRNIGCGNCHGAVENVGLATRDQLPRMRGCFNCHQLPESARGDAKAACPTCHLTERGILRTQFPSGMLEPPPWLHAADHGPDWIERHKSIAGAESQFCANCHREEYCVACHDGRVRPRQIHPNDWLSMHPIAARQNGPSCTSCHRQQSFCLGCHQRAGVAMTGPYADFANRGRFHPPRSVWTDSPRGSGHHAWEAERNLNACVSCHVERDCALCHATARMGGRGAGTSLGFGQGLNPHPLGFRSRCARALEKNARPCLVCHDPSDPKLLECR